MQRADVQRAAAVTTTWAEAERPALLEDQDGAPRLCGRTSRPRPPARSWTLLLGAQEPFPRLSGQDTPPRGPGVVSPRARVLKEPVAVWLQPVGLLDVSPVGFQMSQLFGGLVSQGRIFKVRVSAVGYDSLARQGEGLVSSSLAVLVAGRGCRFVGGCAPASPPAPMPFPSRLPPL